MKRIAVTRNLYPVSAEREVVKRSIVMITIPTWDSLHNAIWERPYWLLRIWKPCTPWQSEAKGGSGERHLLISLVDFHQCTQDSLIGRILEIGACLLTANCVLHPYSINIILYYCESIKKGGKKIKNKKKKCPTYQPQEFDKAGVIVIILRLPALHHLYIFIYLRIFASPLR